MVPRDHSLFEFFMIPVGLIFDPVRHVPVLPRYLFLNKSCILIQFCETGYFFCDIFKYQFNFKSLRKSYIFGKEFIIDNFFQNIVIFYCNFVKKNLKYLKS